MTRTGAKVKIQKFTLDFIREQTTYKSAVLFFANTADTTCTCILLKKIDSKVDKGIDFYPSLKFLHDATKAF